MACATNPMFVSRPCRAYLYVIFRPPELVFPSRRNSIPRRPALQTICSFSRAFGTPLSAISRPPRARFPEPPEGQGQGQGVRKDLLPHFMLESLFFVGVRTDLLPHFMLESLFFVSVREDLLPHFMLESLFSLVLARICCLISCWNPCFR